ncbi:uncharacterized protein AMSG_10444 [Thecamonas trahens ATCC 50062]|uniref:Uncharacterized protein n=1 Tax=Thecamonas trahens ATCC 50062 TaxID=461836 RepID=A0A0L0DQ66_THETB|nr:hypothetical protein AMSG_10444 [Thecamonas trahens ATCC 50062]KNC54449.1 hypothetical protein AMSG_10444 [Thecamonas trahens ATCC 50062]|eukprot:XP_013753605.1 hypothetical protein AMSG_10444 [Thecamonas trahens ATCC 50062]
MASYRRSKSTTKGSSESVVSASGEGECSDAEMEVCEYLDSASAGDSDYFEGEPENDGVLRTVATGTSALGGGAAFCNNHTSTTKYTWWSFVPMQLYEQFRRLANFYFLLIICIQFIPNLSPLNPFASIFPLALVLVITGAKELVEDRRRAKQDKETNSRTTRVLRPGCTTVEEVSWESVRVGDIVYVTSGEAFPCDVILLSTSGEQGTCYIETANLDGETNLKIRQAPSQTLDFDTPEALTKFEGTIECEGPNNRLYTFTGTLYLCKPSEREGTTGVALDNRKVCLRGCNLRNTEWVYGVAVYTGHDTKLMRNSMDPPSKRSQIDRIMNKDVFIIFVFQLVLCAVAGVSNFAYAENTVSKANYMGSLATDAGNDAALSGVLGFSPL